jgi:hypothetical protein
MNYYKYRDTEGFIAGGIRYIEVENGWSLREITVSDNSILASNIKYPLWGLIMSDSQVDYDSIDEVTKIEKSEFAQLWNTHLSHNVGRWLITKLAYPLGTHIQAHILMFYPQGVMIDLGDAVIGVADYKECRASTKPEFMYPNHAITGVVSGHDEQNQWLVISLPQVHQERREMNP